MIIFDDFFGRIVISGLCIALISGPIGCLLIWRRMAFFGDAMAHGSLLGVAVGMAIGINIRFSVLICSLLLALSLSFNNRRSYTSADTRLALQSHGALALGLICLSFFPQIQGDLNNFLFGDFLALSSQDVIYTVSLLSVSLIILWFYWSRFVNWIVSEDIYFIENNNVLSTRLMFHLLVGIFVAVTSKIIGVLLITALMIIPAASARPISKTPVQMAVIASFISAISLLGGFTTSYYYDLPVTATIIVWAIGIFSLTSSSSWSRR